MIDTHCHLLPGLDDGPATETEAIELARRIALDGASFVLCTPHYSQRHPTLHTTATERLRALREGIRNAGISLEVDVAAEVSPGRVVSAPLDELAARSIAARFVLVEVQPDSPVGFFAAVEGRLAEAGLVPVFAHPERSRAVQRHPSVLARHRRSGSLLQVVAPSLIGRWGRAVSAAAWSLLESDDVDLVASDAHGSVRRQPHLREAADLIARRLGRSVSEKLTIANPRLVLEGGQPG
jgi:protein-tyrosine phosphatase